MNASEHIAQALTHLQAAADANHDHLLREQRYSQWHREVLSSARASAARSILTEVHEVRSETEELWTVPDSRLVGDGRRFRLLD